MSSSRVTEPTVTGGDGPSPDGGYSWLVAATGTVAMIATFGTPYSFGVFLTHFADAYPFSEVALTTVFSIELFTFYAGAGAIGFFATRYPSRAILLVCGAVIAALSPALFFVDSYAGLLLVFGLLGAALGTVYVVLAAVVPQWFRDRRGVATGVLFAGIGLSLFVWPPAWQFVFERLGVPHGFLFASLSIAAACVLAGLICRRPPWIDRPSMSVSDLAAWMTEIGNTREFQLRFVGLGLAFGWYYLLAAYSIELFVDRGLAETTAAFAFGLIGGVSILSRIGSGIVADRTGYRRTFFASLWFVLVGSLVLFLPQTPAIYLSIFLFGIGFGGIATLYIPLLLESYDPEKSVAVIGVFNVAFGVFALGLPPLGTALVAHTDSYLGAVALTLATSVGALLCLSRASAVSS